MAGKQLQIDDDYCKAMSKYYMREGMVIEIYILKYIKILQRIREKAIMKGEVADALDTYISHAEKLKGSIYNISKQNARAQVTQFLSAIDEADQYLF